MLHHESLAPLLAMSPAAWIQALFVLASCAVVSITVVPAAERKLLLDYGPRRPRDTPRASHGIDSGPGERSRQAQTKPPQNNQDHAVLKIVRKLTSLGQIPHSWFFTYYALYLVCANFWGFEYFQHGDNELRALARQQIRLAAGSPAMTGGQVVIAWLLMLMQAWRRLYECFAVTRPSNSTMWFVHWIMGLSFYVGASAAIWIEGSGMSRSVTAFAMGDIR